MYGFMVHLWVRARAVVQHLKNMMLKRLRFLYLSCGLCYKGKYSSVEWIQQNYRCSQGHGSVVTPCLLACLLVVPDCCATVSPCRPERVPPHIERGQRRSNIPQRLIRTKGINTTHDTDRSASKRRWVGLKTGNLMAELGPWNQLRSLPITWRTSLSSPGSSQGTPRSVIL